MIMMMFQRHRLATFLMLVLTLRRSLSEPVDVSGQRENSLFGSKSAAPAAAKDPKSDWNAEVVVGGGSRLTPNSPESFVASWTPACRGLNCTDVPVSEPGDF